MKIRALLSTAALLASNALFGQIAYVSVFPTATNELPAMNGVLGCVTRVETVLDVRNVSWSTVPDGSTVPAWTSVTAGPISAGALLGWVNDQTRRLERADLANGSYRALITGGAFSNDGRNRVLRAGFNVRSGGTVRIWGPTLDQFGIYGARNFSWYITDLRDGRQWSGFGETTIYVPQGSSWAPFIEVAVIPTYYYENGNVLVQMDAP